MWRARWKLIGLWCSQEARVTADTCLGLFVGLEAFKHGAAVHPGTWILVLTLFLAPAIVLAPILGAIGNRWSKARLLQGSALAGWLVVAFFGLGGDSWLVCLVLVALSAALYGPMSSALLPAAASASRWPLTCIQGLFTMGAAAALLAGMLMITDSRLHGSLVRDWPADIVVIFLLQGLAWIFALAVDFLVEVPRAESLAHGVRRFFADARMIGKEREIRVCLLGLAGLRGVMAGTVVALFMRVEGSGEDFSASARSTVWIAVGLALGALIAGTQKHPRRILGFVVWGGLGLTGGLAGAASSAHTSAALCLFLGIMAGLVDVPLTAVYQIALAPDARGNGMVLRNLTNALGLALGAVGLWLGLDTADLAPELLLWLLAGAAGSCALAGAWIFRREVVEQLLEVVFSVMYRFGAAGPGVTEFPWRGPVIVVANHAAWMDPIWLAKVLPRSVVPMMTSVFFDHPLLRWMMVHLVHAVRVQASNFRREVPELQDAIAVLDQGQCLVIFPEGRMRRNEEKPLKLFGQGVWHILHDRPQTPVVVCWIEGSWGSFFSYFRGPPTRNKRFDLRHLVSVAIGAPHLLGPEILADHRQTRRYLMEQCVQMRKYLGLEPHVLQQVDFEEMEEDEPFL